MEWIRSLRIEEGRWAIVDIRRSLGSPPPPAIKIGEVLTIHADSAGEVVEKVEYPRASGKLQQQAKTQGISKAPFATTGLFRRMIRLCFVKDVIRVTKLKRV